MSGSRTERALLALGVGLCAVRFATDVHAGISLLTPDSIEYAATARNLVLGRGFTVDIVQYHVGLFDSVRHVPEHHGILRPLVLAALFSVAGPLDRLVSVPSYFYVALTALGALFFARRLFGAPAGLVASLLVLGNDVAWFDAASGIDDVGFMLFVFCFVALAHRGLTRGSDRDLLLAGIFAGLALLEKLAGLFLPPVLFAAALLRAGPPRARLRALALLAAPFAAALALCLLRNYLSHGGFWFRAGTLQLYRLTRDWATVYAYYPEAPDASAVLARMGWGGLFQLG